MKRFRYNINEAIIGLSFEEARLLCLFNGYILGSDKPGYGVLFKLINNKIKEAKIT